MFHVRRRPADSQPRRRKKKPLGAANGANHISGDREGPVLVEVTHSGDGGRRIKLGSDPVEVGSANTNCLQLFGPSIQPRHCLISLLEGVCTVTPLHTDALTFVNGHHISQPTILHVSLRTGSKHGHIEIIYVVRWGNNPVKSLLLKAHNIFILGKFLKCLREYL